MKTQNPLDFRNEFYLIQGRKYLLALEMLDSRQNQIYITDNLIFTVTLLKLIYRQLDKLNH